MVGDLLFELIFDCPFCNYELKYSTRNKYINMNSVCLCCKKAYNIVWDAKSPTNVLVKKVRRYTKSEVIKNEFN